MSIFNNGKATYLEQDFQAYNGDFQSGHFQLTRSDGKMKRQWGRVGDGIRIKWYCV